jgi:hypothetical protein
LRAFPPNPRPLLVTIAFDKCVVSVKGRENVSLPKSRSEAAAYRPHFEGRQTSVLPMLLATADEVIE